MFLSQDQNNIFKQDSAHYMANYGIKWRCLLFFGIPVICGTCIKSQPVLSNITGYKGIGWM